MNSRANPIISAFTEEQVTRLTGISQRQLRYWAQDNFFKPSISIKLADDGEAGVVWAYSFRDLVCLKVINALRNDARVPLSHLREVKDKLSHLGEDLWAKTTLYVLGKRVVIENSEDGTREEALSGQGVLQIPLRVVTGNMEEAVRLMRQRDHTSIGKIEKKRGVANNQPVISGTRIPVQTIKSFAEAGYSVDDILKQYPSLTAEDVRAALNFKEVA